MVDSNLQRERVLPSERAFVYKMKLEAMLILVGTVKMADRVVREMMGL